MKNEWRTILEVGLIALFILVVIIVLIGLDSRGACDVYKPTAGQIVNCIGTRTAEATISP